MGPLGRFQPSELTKIAVILFTAYIVNTAPKKLDKFVGFLRVVLFIAPLLGLIIIENFSTALICGIIMVAICFVASRKKLYFIISGLLFGALGSIFIFFVSYRSERIKVWLNVETEPKGYQILQGLYAIASGGIFGKGLGESMQKLGFIPESHNDMIFSVICEELGLFGAFALILLFILLIWRIFIIAINATDLFGGLIATGVLTHIASQVLINIAVVTNAIPSTGIPLPFISYGGSSVMVILFEMGIVLSVSNQIKGEK
jgi:cell division protein FtsW